MRRYLQSIFKKRTMHVIDYSVKSALYSARLLLAAGWRPVAYHRLENNQVRIIFKERSARPVIIGLSKEAVHARFNRSQYAALGYGPGAVNKMAHLPIYWSQPAYNRSRRAA